ncbi:hypothetical protein [Fodinicola feengrottensis]|uniref:hypothetical protein n=1 Tax=Fodinicola feengrottensis TaxID=435914 RepID=UPI0013D35110|nr:hypothetical protein [Fodinicola feengrottensis]
MALADQYAGVVVGDRRHIRRDPHRLGRDGAVRELFCQCWWDNLALVRGLRVERADPPPPLPLPYEVG